MPRTKALRAVERRRLDPEEFRQNAVQMMLDGHSAASLVWRRGLSCGDHLDRWKNVTTSHVPG